MTKSKVLAVHDNRRHEITPNLGKFCQAVSGQPQAFIEPCQLKNPVIQYFIIVSIGIDTRQIIGFDTEDKVVYMIQGDT